MTKEKSSVPNGTKEYFAVPPKFRTGTVMPMRSGPVTGLNRFPLLKGFKGKARKRMTRGFRGRLAATAVLSETIAFCGGVLRHSGIYYITQILDLQAKGLFSLLLKSLFFVGVQNTFYPL